MNAEGQGPSPSNLARIWAALEEYGITLSLEAGDGIRCSPTPPLPLRNAIAEHRDAIAEALRREAETAGAASDPPQAPACSTFRVVRIAGLELVAIANLEDLSDEALALGLPVFLEDELPELRAIPLDAPGPLGLRWWWELRAEGMTAAERKKRGL